MSEFNLIDEPWIPCIDLGGKQVEYGIRDTLTKAHELREICDDSPLVTVAIHRLLLAILYRAFQGPSGMKEWTTLYRAGSFAGDERLDNYLDRWRHRFYLFDDSHPFMQVAGLDLNDYKGNGELKKDKSDGFMRLAKEAPDKSGRILFDHRVGTERPEYEPKQVAKMIISAQSFAGTGVASYGRISSKAIRPTVCQFAPCVDGLCLWLEAESLFLTILLNLIPRAFCANDLPAWEDQNVIQYAIKSWQSPVNFSGSIQRFAPLSRFIRAIDKRSCFFTNGLKVAADADDPMKAYYRESDSKPFVAVKLMEYKAAWRDAHTLFAVGIHNFKPPECLNFAARLHTSNTIGTGLRFRANVVGLATKQDKGLLWRHERMPVPAALLSNNNLKERLDELIKTAEEVARELNRRTLRIAKLYLAPNAESPEGGQPDKDEVTRIKDSIDPRPAYWSRLEQHFYTLLENLPDDWDAAQGGWKPDEMNATNDWLEHIKREARRALEESVRSLGTTARALQAVARVRTDFNNDDLKPKQPYPTKSKEEENVNES